MDRQNISSGVKWENVVGYSRAVRVNNIIEVSGTTAIDEYNNVVSDKAYEQTSYILTKIEKALKKAGASLNNVVRTRIYVTNIAL